MILRPMIAKTAIREWNFKMMKKIFLLFLCVSFVTGLPFVNAGDRAGSKDQSARAGQSKPTCDTSRTTVCTVEIWLGHKQKKKNKEIRDFLKSHSIKVLRHTIQYWKPRGGHPPTNIALGGHLSAEDARLVMDLALKYNDKIEYLILQRLNPPNYAAIATSAWDDASQTAISPEDLERLRDPKLTTEEFHALYVNLTGEKTLPPKFY